MNLFLKSLSEVKEEWVRLFEVTPEVSPFLQYDAFAIAWNYFYPYYITGLCRPKIAQFVDAGKTIALIPVTVKINSAQLFGAPNGFNESCVLFEDKDILPHCFRLLHERFSSVELIKIDERSPIAEFRPDGCAGIANVAISFGDDFDGYFKFLSSSVRQNIRTSYNRLEKDGHTYELAVYANNGSAKLGG